MFLGHFLDISSLSLEVGVVRAALVVGDEYEPAVELLWGTDTVFE